MQDAQKRYLYLYGVIPKGQTVPHIAESSFEVMTTGQLAALVELVPASEFSPETVEAKLQSIEWVGPVARKHEGILELAMQHGPVFPARLCTLFTSADALRASLAENEERFLLILEKFAGRREWGLKVYCDEKELAKKLAVAHASNSARDARSPAQAYILAKQQESRAAEDALTHIDKVVDEIISVLDATAFEMSAKPSLSESVTGRPETMVLNLAALIEDSAQDTFQAAVRDLTARFGVDGFSLEVSGPWPPYSFSDGDGGDEEEPDEDATPSDFFSSPE